MTDAAASASDSSRLIRAWLSVQTGAEMDEYASDELPDIPAPRSRAERQRRRDQIREKINWQQTQDEAATTSEAQDQAKLDLNVKPETKKLLKGEGKLMTQDAVPVAPSSDTLPIEDAVETVSTAGGTGAHEAIAVDSDPEKSFDMRRVRLFGCMQDFRLTIQKLKHLREQTHFISDGEVFSKDNAELAQDLVIAGKMLQEEGQKLVQAGTDYAAMCDKIAQQKEAEEAARARRELERDEDASTDEEDLVNLYEARPRPNCHNVEATGDYLVGKQSQKQFKHQCTVCLRTFQQYETLQGHKLIHTKDSLTCKICFMSCTSHEYLRLHMTGHAVGGFTCDDCGAHFLVKTSYLNHLKKHTDETFSCPHCGKTYKWKSGLTVHLKKEHLPRADAGDKGSDGDDEAGDAATAPKKKKQKGTVAAKDERVTCGLCPKMTFKNVYSLRTHSSKLHSNKVKKKKQ